MTVTVAHESVGALKLQVFEVHGWAPAQRLLLPLDPAQRALPDRGANASMPWYRQE